MPSHLTTLPLDYHADVERAVRILKASGCKDVYLFGSLISGRSDSDSDIDIAIRGCPEGKFFHILGTLMMELEHPVDLVDLDKEPRLAAFLEDEAQLVHVE